MQLLALAIGLLFPAHAGDGPWVGVSGNVGVGSAGMGRGGGGAVAVGWQVPLLHHALYLGPLLRGSLAGHRAGGLHQEDQLDATIRFQEGLYVRDAELGFLASAGKMDGLRGELALAGGWAATRHTVTGDLDGTELPGSTTSDRGWALWVGAGGTVPVGPLDLAFAVDWKRVPAAGVPVNLVGPRIGLRWGPL